MTFRLLLIVSLTGLAAIASASGCTPLALQPVTSTGLVVYTKGASQHTAKVQLAVSPDDVFAGMLAIISGMPDVKIVNQDDGRFFVEVVVGSRRLSGQATDLGRGETLLFVWADAGDNGKTGRELAREAVELLCSELAVACTMQDI